MFRPSSFGLRPPLVAMLPPVAVPLFDGKGEYVLHYAMGVEMWCEATDLSVGKRASAVVLLMESTPRDASMAMGSDKLAGTDAVDARLLHAGCPGCRLA